jgi:mannose-6-phosphate isomerase-like protein (cupin superfamily)
VAAGLAAEFLGEGAEVEGEEEVMLEPFDVFSVPPGIMRGLRNVGTEPAHILAILGGTDPGKQHGRRI